MPLPLPTKIADYLNQGDAVVAEIGTDLPNTRCFVTIRPRKNPDFPSEHSRYMNSKFSMWEYWAYDFRCMVLRAGWENHEADYDQYLLSDEKLQTHTELEFDSALAKWVRNPLLLRHHFDSDCPE